MTEQFVTAFTGARDWYELPLALHEMNRLCAHVADFYYPDALLKRSFGLPRKLRNRHRDGLPSRCVHVDLEAAVRKNLLPPGKDPDPFLAVDRALSLAAARVSRRTGSHLFLHSQYAYWAFEALPDRKKFLFQFHPHAASVRPMLEEDYAAHPEVRWSYENELDSQPLHLQRLEALEEWRLADRIVCASSFTKRTLVQQGCREEIISVVPYGLFPQTAGANPQHRNGRVCRFAFVGQGVQRKGLHLLLKAWKAAAPSRAELVVVARMVDPGLRPLLNQPGIRYYPGVDRKVLTALYEDSAVFIMPSLVEGFGLVYLEALAAGLHCIGTLHSGLADLGLPDSCVTIVPHNKSECLVDALLARCADFWSGKLNKDEISSRVRHLTSDFRRAELRSAIQRMVQTC
jgi:glycosyltransferase involved in cell wall biosynthesis